MYRFSAVICLIIITLVSCEPKVCPVETNVSFFPDTSYHKIVLEGILIYGDNLHEFRETKTQEVYFIKDNSHTIRTRLKNIATVDYQPVYAKIEADSIGLPTYGSALNYQHVIYLHKILSMKEQIEKKDDVAKDTSIVNDKESIAFKAMGNEPFWSIIIKEAAIGFSTNIGQTESFPYKNARRYHKSNVIEVANDSQNKIYIIISDEPCFDNMSGREFGNRVKIIYNNSTTYYGCGNLVKEKKQLPTE